MVTHVDDCFVVGHLAAIDKTIDLIMKSGLELKIEKNVMDYSWCGIRVNQDNTKAWICQQNMVNKIEKNVGDLVKLIGAVNRPGTSNYNLVQPKNDGDKISKEDQKIYGSGVRRLLYLVKHSRPDISNPVWELAKGMSGATPAAFK
jgi:rRNA processing protein Gar1